MNENFHRRKSFCSVTLPYRCNSHVSQVSKKQNLHFCDTWLSWELHLQGSVTAQKKTFSSVTVLVHRHFLDLLFIVGLNARYPAKYIPSPMEVPSGFTLGNSHRQRAIFDHIPLLSRPYTDIVYTTYLQKAYNTHVEYLYNTYRIPV